MPGGAVLAPGLQITIYAVGPVSEAPPGDNTLKLTYQADSAEQAPHGAQYAGRHDRDVRSVSRQTNARRAAGVVTRHLPPSADRDTAPAAGH